MSFEEQLVGLIPRLRRFAHALSRNRSDADDLAQTTIERALRSRVRWEPGTRLDSWLYKIMRNIWIDTARARSRRERFEAPAEDAEGVGRDGREAMDAHLELNRMMTLMGRLPNEQREVLALILVEGWGYQETAEMLGMPVGTIASRLARGRTALLKLMGEQ